MCDLSDNCTSLVCYWWYFKRVDLLRRDNFWLWEGLLKRSFKPHGLYCSSRHFYYVKTFSPKINPLALTRCALGPTKILLWRDRIEIVFLLPLTASNILSRPIAVGLPFLVLVMVNILTSNTLNYKTPNSSLFQIFHVHCTKPPLRRDAI